MRRRDWRLFLFSQVLYDLGSTIARHIRRSAEAVLLSTIFSAFLLSPSGQAARKFSLREAFGLRRGEHSRTWVASLAQRRDFTVGFEHNLSARPHYIRGLLANNVSSKFQLWS